MSAAPPASFVEDPAHFGNRRVEATQGADQAQTLCRLRGVPAVSAGTVGHLRQQSSVRVEADGLDTDTHVFGHFTDGALTVVRREHLNLPQGEFLRYGRAQPGDRAGARRTV
ncbi:hypothetical protein GCM10010518_02780 [Kitasatospora cinereorecta]